MSAPPVEVEFKFPVPELEPIRHRLSALGGRVVDLARHRDEYLNDPLRDFAKLDVALRFRQIGDRYWLTWKGPAQDSVAKIRSEIETPLHPASAKAVRRTFLEIGFFPVAVVAKQRETWELEGLTGSVCLDDVEEVGCFVELEIIADQAADVDPAKRRLLKLADQLELQHPIRTSYLELLLDRRSSQ